MNTNLLKKFAQETRIKLLGAVETKLNYVLNGDSADLRDYTESIQILKKDIKKMGKEALIDKVAYTWFNRLMALRFMDANDYQPLGLKVISPKLDFTQPEILDEASQGNIPQELEVDRQRINDLLDGKIKVLQPQNEIYRMLLIASCNNLHGLFPFLFEKIKDYTELLLPDDLISELSIIQDFVQGMTEEDCQEVEMIGWLYQFYISDKKDEVFAKRGKVEKDEIPAATQLFTPRWIVEYMVQNTVGKLWLQNHPDSALRERMPYYIETESSKGDEYLKIASPEEITLLDQACGSGHILVYGFELLYQIYEEAGYTASRIPRLIIEKNLVGYEIDERAAQLASFSILMKARSYYRRLFRKPVQPHILCFQDLRLTDDEIEAAFGALDHEISDDVKHDLQSMQQATNLGSLIQPRTAPSELKNLSELLQEKKETDDLFFSRSFTELYTAILQLTQLNKKFHCVVQNPPYMGSGKMNKELSRFVKNNFPEAKSDLFSCFIERSISKSFPDGIIGNVTMESWMFLSSFEKFRKSLLKNVSIDSLSHFGWHIMRIAFGTVSLILRNSIPRNTDMGVYNYLEIDDIDRETGRPIDFPNKKRRYAIKNQKDFEKIPGSNIGYWLSKDSINKLSESQRNQILDVRKGLSTGSVNRFMRYWYEIDIDSMAFDHKDGLKWYKYFKGGKFRRWYGNKEFVVNWANNGSEIKNFKDDKGKQRSRPQNVNYYFKEGCTYSALTSSLFSVRYMNNGIFGGGGDGIFVKKNISNNCINGFYNSKVVQYFFSAVSATMNYEVSHILSLPIFIQINNNIDYLVSQSIKYSRQEWNSRETSWDFIQNELIRVGSGAPVVSGRGMVDSELVDGERGMVDGEDGRVTSIEEAVERYKDYWTKKFIQLHRNEEELNARFIEIYGLQEELTPDVPLDEITILREELDQRKLKKISEKFSSGWELVDGDQWMVDGEGREAPVDGEGSGAPVNGRRWIVDGVSATRRDRGGEEESVISHESPVTNHYPPLPFDEQELIKQFTSYAVGCMMGRYSLEKPGLILANQGETISDYVRIVDSGQWMVDGGLVDGEQWMVDGEGNKKQRYDKGLQGSENMAAEHGSGEDGLSGDGKDAEGRAVQSDGSDQTGSSEHSKQYSRGASERDAGISSLSSDRSRFTGRTGDPADPDRESPDAGGERSEADFDAGFPSEKTDPQSDEFTEKENKVQPLITKNQPQFLPDDDGIIPVLDSEWFEDDIVTQFYQFVRTVWGAQDFQRNIDYIEKTLKKSIRDYFNRDFYNDHIRRYKKRPIYWLFSSPTGAFQVLVYLHRYTRNTLHNILNDYLRPYIDKLENHIDHLNHIVVEGSAREQTQARKDIVRTEKMIEELRKYDKEVLYPLAIRQIDIDLDDGVLVNYNKFGEAVKRVQGLNDPKKKAQVKKFDWIDGSEII